MSDEKIIRILLGFISQMTENAMLTGDEMNKAVGVMAVQWVMDNNFLGVTLTPSLLLRFKEEATQAVIETFGNPFEGD